MPADVLTFADEVVALLATTFAAQGKAPALSREYEFTLDLGTFDGLVANVYPLAYGKDSAATRREDLVDAECVIVVAERYAPQARRVPRDWLDERVNLVEAAVFDPLRAHALLLGGVRWLSKAEVTTVYDLKLLRQHKVFWSEVEVVFRRLRAA